MCRASRGDLLFVTHPCSIVENDPGNAHSIMLGHHIGDDVELLYPQEVALVLRHFVGTVVGHGYRDHLNRIIERDIIMPAETVESGSVHCYLVFVRGRKVYVREHYIEGDQYGLSDMSCLELLGVGDTYPRGIETHGKH